MVMASDRRLPDRPAYVGAMAAGERGGRNSRVVKMGERQRACASFERARLEHQKKRGRREEVNKEREREREREEDGGLDKASLEDGRKGKKGGREHVRSIYTYGPVPPHSLQHFPPPRPSPRKNCILRPQASCIVDEHSEAVGGRGATRAANQSRLADMGSLHTTTILVGMAASGQNQVGRKGEWLQASPQRDGHDITASRDCIGFDYEISATDRLLAAVWHWPVFGPITT